MPREPSARFEMPDTMSWAVVVRVTAPAEEPPVGALNVRASEMPVEYAVPSSAVIFLAEPLVVIEYDVAVSVASSGLLPAVAELMVMLIVPEETEITLMSATTMVTV